MSQLMFSNNEAQYGQNIASYAVKIVSSGTSTNKINLENVASGLEYEDALNFDLVDIDNQLMNLEINPLKLNTIEANTSITGTNEARLDNGTASFEGVIFGAETGAKNIRYQ